MTGGGWLARTSEGSQVISAGTGRFAGGRERDTAWALPQPDWVTSGQGQISPRALKRRPYFSSKQNSSISLVITFQQVIFFFLIRPLFTFFAASCISCCIWWQ